jgi:class 3 adenylate cyclase
LAEHGLRLRAGIHVGDVELRGDDVSGLAVHVAARIMSHADADETLVSEAARQAALGSRHHFDATRTTQLKGLPEQWTLHRTIP